MAKKKEAGAKIESLDKYPNVTFITSGVKKLDAITGGGFPMGRITEIFGAKAVGKSSLMLIMLAAISKEKKVLYCDVENSLSVPRFVSLGGDPKNVHFSTTSVLEDVGELIIAQIPNYDVIILDSVAGATTRTELQSEVGDHLVGVKAKVMNSIFSRRLPEMLASHNTALIVINQLRDNFNLYTSDKQYTPGGRAIEYAASLRIKLTTLSADKIMDGKERVGHFVNASVEKSKVGVPYKTCRFQLLYT